MTKTNTPANDVLDRCSRIGLFGGTFNPIHNGHVLTAKDVLRQFELDRIYFIPSAYPPHKCHGMLAAAQDRYDMVRLALDTHEGLKACDAEIRRKGPTYSFDTLAYFNECKPSGCELFFLLGVDAFLEIHTWKNYDKLFELTSFIVMTRPGNIICLSKLCKKINTFVRNKLNMAYSFDSAKNVLTHSDLKPIYLTQVSPVDITSSQLRHMIISHQCISSWVAAQVESFIQKKGLYL
ncbi:MAG: nicotinate (nicotinamide) nucleotide adenylyltransferase [Desulfobacteraceae bacterium]|nr:nicotinate (nicotinamide) nucleotide adenylyltransferase [Desulfobacteraceae bacterium]